MNIDRLGKNNDIELPEQYDGLPTFVVGGWIRSHLRGVEPSDVDLLVAEVSPDEMQDRGFHKIDSANNDTFAVFHDSLNREVAIAREEQSTGDGHNDFSVEPVPEDVPASEAVERDLPRRCLSINAMAFDLRWNVLHDPFDGVQDIEDGVLRCINDKAFEQDALRILRIARFASRTGYDIETETKNLMSENVNQR